MTSRLSSLGVEISPYVMSERTERGHRPCRKRHVGERGQLGIRREPVGRLDRLGSLSEPGSLVMIESPKPICTRDSSARCTQILADFAKEGKQMLITSHSDHVLQEMRKLVLDGTVPADDVKVYHFAKEDRVTRASEIDVTDGGSARAVLVGSHATLKGGGMAVLYEDSVRPAARSVGADGRGAAATG